MLYKLLIFFSFCLLFMRCSSKEKEQADVEIVTSTTSNNNQVYSFSNKQEFEAFKALQLDSTHANLLNPQVAKESYQEVSQAWVKLHSDIGTFLAKNDFKWNSSDSAIKVFHKIYFDPTGHIKHHFINVLTPSVSELTKKEFSKLLHQFGSTYQLDLKRDSSFAQCGKTRYAN